MKTYMKTLRFEYLVLSPLSWPCPMFWRLLALCFVGGMALASFGASLARRSELHRHSQPLWIHFGTAQIFLEAQGPMPLTALCSLCGWEMLRPWTWRCASKTLNSLDSGHALTTVVEVLIANRTTPTEASHAFLHRHASFPFPFLVATFRSAHRPSQPSQRSTPRGNILEAAGNGAKKQGNAAPAKMDSPAPASKTQQLARNESVPFSFPFPFPFPTAFPCYVPFPFLMLALPIPAFPFPSFPVVLRGSPAGKCSVIWKDDLKLPLMIFYQLVPGKPTAEVSIAHRKRNRNGASHLFCPCAVK